MDFIQYIYVYLWAFLAVMTIVVGRKEGALSFVMAGFFVFLAVWYGIRAFAGIAMFDGVLGVIFRCTAAAFAVAMGLVWYLKRRGKK